MDVVINRGTNLLVKCLQIICSNFLETLASCNVAKKIRQEKFLKLVRGLDK